MNTDQLLADALEAPLELVPWLPDLLQDLCELGDMSDRAVEMLGSLDLPPTSRVLDLGCGKGYLACKLARKLGWSVTGVDLCASFVDTATQAAHDLGVADRCHFYSGGAQEFLETKVRYDVITLVSVGRLHRTLSETVGAVRRTLRDGGYFVVEDVYLLPDAANPVGIYGDLPSKQDVLNELRSYGDRLIAELENDVESVSRFEEHSLRVIRKRAAELAEQRPELRVLLEQYVDMQRRANIDLRTKARAALWLLEKMEASPPRPE